MEQETKLLLAPIDLDLIGDIADVYERAKNTIKYLSDFCSSIDARLLKGEEIPRLEIVRRTRTRFITGIGAKVLIRNLGEKFYTKKPIGITELENLLGKDKIEEFIELGIVDLKEETAKIIVND